MTTTSRTVAVFDFDHTLIKSDSFWTFLAFVAGWPRTIVVFIQILLGLAFRILKDRNDPETDTIRTFLKTELMQRLLAGHSLSTTKAAAEKLYHWQIWNESVRKELLEHKVNGHYIVIASGGLDLYLPTLLKDIPYDALICTETGVTNGVITGTMPSGNCVRERKAELVAAYIEKNGPFAESWGYGNYPDDIPMMNLLKHRVIV